MLLSIKTTPEYMVRTAQRDPHTAAAARGDHVYPRACLTSAYYAALAHMFV